MRMQTKRVLRMELEDMIPPFIALYFIGYFAIIVVLIWALIKLVLFFT